MPATTNPWCGSSQCRQGDAKLGALLSVLTAFVCFAIGGFVDYSHEDIAEQATLPTCRLVTDSEVAACNPELAVWWWLQEKLQIQEELENEKFLALNQDTSDLYGIIHARYIRSSEGKSEFFRRNCSFLGLALVYGRYLQGAYGYCPRALCDK